jgi:hypothetical protein
MKTKLEIFCAYLPYSVGLYDINHCYYSTLHSINTAHSIDDKVLILRPLAAIFTPMQHPLTRERIENPAAWIAKKLGAGYSGRAIRNYLEGNNNDLTEGCHYSRQIDALALELYFDIYGAIEKGFAIEYGAAQ